MSETYVPIPDLTAGRPKYGREQDIFKWLRAHCEWREGQKSHKESLFKAYAAWELAEYGLPVAPRSIEQSLITLGHNVDGEYIFGAFLRRKEATPAPPKHSPSLQGGTAALVFPRELSISPTDDPIVRAQKEAYNEALHPKPKPEITFVEHGPARAKSASQQ
jgi:hypothetical protein